MIPDIAPVNSWTGNNETKKFEFDFLINSQEELKVLYTNVNQVQTELKLNIDYSINEIGNKNGSYITFPLENSEYGLLQENETISLLLNIPLAQTTPFATSGLLNLNSLEYALDYIVRLIQIIYRQVERSVKIQEGSKDKPEDYFEYITNASTQANEYANQAKGYVDESETLKIETQSARNQSLAYLNEVRDITENFDADIQELVGYVDAAKNEGINAINNEKNNAINSINETGAEIIDKAEAWATSDNEIEEGLYSSKYYADMVKNSIPDNFTTLPIGTMLSINASKYYSPSGCLSCDGREFKREDFKQLWNNYLTSQKVFDRDSITVVGNPTITEDGVASGFSANNYILIPQIFTQSNSWEIKITITTSNVLTGQDYFCNLGQQSFALNMNNQKLNWNLSSNGTNWNLVSNRVGKTILQQYSTYFIIIQFTGSEYKLLLSQDKINWSLEDSFSSTNKLYNSEYSVIGTNRFRDSAFSGSIDLKEFSIKVDGQTVFDCVLDGDYTVNDLVGKQGNPTIRKGKAYNFTNADYLHFNSDFLVNNGYGLVIKLRLPSVLSKQYFCTYRGIDSNGKIGYPTGAGTGSSIQGIPSSNLYFRILGFAKENTDLIFNYQISTDGKTWLGDESARNYGYYANGFSIGADNYWSSETKQAFSGSIDLSESYLFKNTPDEKIYLCDVVYYSRLNTCSYGTYEKELKEYGQCSKFAVKPLEYDGSGLTITGSPTITENGIASKLNKTNYITLPSIDVNALKWKLQGRIKPTLAPNNTFYITNLYLGIKGFTLYRDITGGIVIDIVINVDNVETRFKINTPVHWVLGKAYDFFIQRDNGIFSFGSKEVSELNYTVRQSEDKGNYPLADGTINLMQSYDTNDAEFDLKQFKIEVDGQTVFDCVEGDTFKVPTTSNSNYKDFVVVANGYADDCLVTWNTLVELENYLKGV